MPIYFEFTTNINNYKISYLNTNILPLQSLLYNHSHAYNAILGLANYFTGSNSFRIKVNSLEDTFLIAIFIKDEEKLVFQLSEDTITVSKETENGYDTYSFIYSFETDRISLYLTEISLKSCGFYQKFNKHEIVLTKVIGTKSFNLTIPLDVDSVFDNNKFQSLNSSSTLRDLLEFYYDNFYHDQKPYDRREITSLEITDLTKLDELETVTIINGQVDKYTVKKSNDKFTLILTKKIGSLDYEVSLNYITQVFDIDINDLIKRFKNQAESFEVRPILRVLKPQG